jgi:hypothetical protein
MRTFIITALLLLTLSAAAQWSNTTNHFFDSLHMPVSNVLQSQDEPLIVRSYPDGGYFFIWQDNRNAATTKTDIYAQKYDANGVRLWSPNGNPVTTGPNAQFYRISSNQDYRNRSFAATDSAGGFYICYVDDSVTNYSWPRIAVQHMRNDGSAVFSGAGFIAASIPSNENYSFYNPTLIADGNKGFYLGFIKNPYSGALYVVNYRDESGTMKYYGGGIVTQNAVQKYRLNSCGTQPYVEYPGINVGDYHIWPDGQGGCNIVMSLSANGSQGTMLGFNRLWRAKKDARVRTLYRNESGIACPQVWEYKKDNVYLLYQLKTHFTTTTCASLDGQYVYVVTNTFVTSNGFQVLDQGAYDYGNPKGATLFTDGNINIDMIAAVRRTITNNTVSDFTVQGYAYKVEKFDSVPYQRTSYDDPDIGYNTFEPPLDKFVPFRDTLLASGNYYLDFSLAGGGQDFFAASLMSTTGSRQVRLQNIRLLRQSSDSFSFWRRAPERGQVIGAELSTGFTGNSISYDIPLITFSPNGNAMFSIKDGYRSIRISPIDDGTALRWGAMGRPIGTSIYKSSYYNADEPVIAMDGTGNTGVIAWRDNRYIPPTNTFNNIYMRHLNNLNSSNYSPPRMPVIQAPNPYGASESNPYVLYGTSHVFTPIELSNLYFEPSTTTLAEIQDNFYLGRVRTFIHQHTGAAVRMYNGQPYLNRNLTIVSDSTPPGADIGMRLYFTKEEFNALKAADNSIVTPGDLLIINQPYVPNITPTTYTPVGGEVRISPQSWDSLPGGFYIQFNTARLGNFFVMKSATAIVCPGGNVSIASSLSGTTYQWQMDIGMGFYNITTDPHYTGTNTATLQLLSIPSSWYGYKFRCVVNGSPSDVVSLRFLANWTGNVNTDWNNPSNWGCGTVPDANTDVVINSGTVILNANGACRTLTVKPGATFKVNPGFNLLIAQ